MHVCLCNYSHHSNKHRHTLHIHIYKYIYTHIYILWTFVFLCIYIHIQTLMTYGNYFLFRKLTAAKQKQPVIYSNRRVQPVCATGRCNRRCPSESFDSLLHQRTQNETPLRFFQFPQGRQPVRDIYTLPGGVYHELPVTVCRGSERRRQVKNSTACEILGNCCCCCNYVYSRVTTTTCLASGD